MAKRRKKRPATVRTKEKRAKTLIQTRVDKEKYGDRFTEMAARDGLSRSSFARRVIIMLIEGKLVEARAVAPIPPGPVSVEQPKEAVDSGGDEIGLNAKCPEPLPNTVGDGK